MLSGDNQQWRETAKYRIFRYLAEIYISNMNIFMFGKAGWFFVPIGHKKYLARQMQFKIQISVGFLFSVHKWDLQKLNPTRQ